ncbi:origin recognition complex subunit 2 [Laetiporus sulphureus 93-53]|uniref:Origin recognition complex subunit 2 n=1 Tax=Laetiporus sulphureus 93-53 TaxID=1314785 RepID=A0A165HCY0_9APHY|nr:origin recognition complex subunit 2 [Laetiporus sulphureus 93-53]KZT11565.1 origin recognition complex subunit 2 [Laetiporus sulphureus 93-53]
MSVYASESELSYMSSTRSYATGIDTEADEDLEDDASPAPAPAPSPARSSHYASRRRPEPPADDDYDDAPGAAPADVPFGFSARTAFDAYFEHASRPARTSATVFSQLLAPLTPAEYAAALARARAPASDALSNCGPLWENGPVGVQRKVFARWAVELGEGFNLLFYGYGSKRRVLNVFGTEVARGRVRVGPRVGGQRERGGRGRTHVLVCNGFQPGFALKDLLGAVEAIPALEEALEEVGAGAGKGTSVEAQTQRVYDVFSREGKEERLLLVIHNIDGPGLRGAKAKAALALLALASRIHIVASVDHIAAPTRWTLSELFARKDLPFRARPQASSSNVKGKGKGKAKDTRRQNTDGNDLPTSGSHPTIPRRGFAWLWHDLTTLAPYDLELASADPSSLSGASFFSSSSRRTQPTAPGAPGASRAQIVTESAARHVLASVTQKARKLFVLLGGKQLELMEAPGAGGVEGAASAAYDYDRLFAAARDEFVATSDTALRALLGEFRDHGLVVSVAAAGGGAGGGGEALWIPMRRDALGKIVAELQAEGI